MQPLIIITDKSRRDVAPIVSEAAHASKDFAESVMPTASLAPVRSSNRNVQMSCETCPLGMRGACPSSEQFAGVRLHRVSSKRVEGGTDIYTGQEAPQTVAILQSGWAIQSAHSTSCGRQILTFLVPGDVFDQDAIILAHSPSLFAYSTLTDSTVCFFDMEQYRTLLSADVRSKRFAKRQIRRHQELMAKHMISIGRRRALGRVAGLLLELRQRLSEQDLVADDVMPFPLRQEDIADALGLTHAHVNRTLKSLRDAGIITYDQGTLRILDVPTLHRNVPGFVPLSA